MPLKAKASLHNIAFASIMAATLLLAGCSSEEDVVVMSPLPVVENQFTPVKAWNTSVGNGSGKFYVDLRPDYYEKTIYAAERYGYVKAIDSDSGKTLWKVDLAHNGGWFSRGDSARLSGGVTATKEMLFIGSENAEVFALDRQTGEVKWQVKVAGEALSRPVVAEGKVLIHTSNGMLQALNSNNGKLVWTTPLDMPTLSLRGKSAPAIAQGAAFVGGDNGRINAVMLSKGQMIWQQRTSQNTAKTEIARLNDSDVTPRISGNTLYTIAYNGDLLALDLHSGKVKWQRELGSVHNFILQGNYIYLVDQSDNVISVDRSNGQKVWRQSALKYRLLTAPVLYKDLIVVADSEGYVHWLNRNDGKFVAQQDLDSSGFLSTPIVVNEKLVIQSKDGEVYALSR